MNLDLGIGNLWLKRNNAKKRCKSFFSTDKNLETGCKKWAGTLSKPDEFQSPETYLETLNQELLIATYGVDLVANDETTTESVFGEESNIYLFFGGLVLLLIIILWIQLRQ